MSDSPTIPEAAATPPVAASVTRKRKHLVESAGYWFNGAFKAGLGKAEALMTMENAYNHVENALFASREEVNALRASLAQAEQQIADAADAFKRIRSLVGASDNDAMPAESYVERVVIDRDRLQARVAEIQADLHSTERLLDHCSIKDRDSQDEQPWSLSDRISHLLHSLAQVEKERGNALNDTSFKTVLHQRDMAQKDRDRLQARVVELEKARDGILRGNSELVDRMESERLARQRAESELAALKEESSKSVGIVGCCVAIGSKDGIDGTERVTIMTTKAEIIRAQEHYGSGFYLLQCEVRLLDLSMVDAARKQP